MSSMRSQKFLIHNLFIILSVQALLLCLSCSKGGSPSSAGMLLEGQGGQVQLPQEEAGVGTASTAGTQSSLGTAGSGAAGTAVLARAEKTLPHPSREELAKLDAVWAGLSPRAREAMPVNASNRAEFLTDLAQVLEEEKGFRSDDLSLFYLIDKKHNVGADYVPKDLVLLEKNNLFDINKNNLSLRPEAYEALRRMSRAALDDGVRLLVSSTYRSYEYQTWLFQHWVDVDGLEEAERESARAGTSQHQLGVAVDFGSISDDFADTKMGQWVYAHSEEFGWSLSFPQGYEDVTGFRWESWHFRYIGRTACDFQRKWFSDVQQFMIEFIDAWKNA